MRDDDGLDEGDRKLLDDIDSYGWHVLKIRPTETEPPFAFSVGLFHTFGHPEIVVVGMNLDLMGRMVNVVGGWLRAGQRIGVDKPYAGLLEGFDCIFRPVAAKWYPEYLGYALWFYRDSSFPVLQCIWPDKQRRWPWEPEFNPAWKPMQRLLYL